jgi:hypothetical protein
MDLVKDSSYRINIHLPFDDIDKHHPFVCNRLMRYEGIDTEWSGKETSYIFSDAFACESFYDSIKDHEAYKVFSRMTYVCQSRVVDGRWYIHICEYWHDGRHKLFDAHDIP